MFIDFTPAPVEPKPEGTVSLTLTETEAAALFAVVGGVCDLTEEQISHNLYNGLKKLDLPTEKFKHTFSGGGWSLILHDKAVG